MMVETDKSTGCWPGVLTRKDYDMMIKLRLQSEIHQRYGQEIQALCKTQAFGPVNDSCTGEMD